MNDKLKQLVFWVNNKTPLNEQNLNNMRNLIIDLFDEYNIKYEELDTKFTKRLDTLEQDILVDSMYFLSHLNGIINPALRAGNRDYQVLYDKYGFEIYSYEKQAKYPSLTYVERDSREIEQEGEI